MKKVTQVSTQQSQLPEVKLERPVTRLATMRRFLEIPNPAILKVFVISSFATLISGFALAIEWFSHGKNHTEFGWIIYYALFLIFLPLLIWILMAISSSSRCSSQIADSVAAKEPPCTEVSEGNRTEEEETKRNSCRSLAVVVESDERKNKDEKTTPRIKRAVSFPSHGKVRSCRTR
ncbi:unnamed protein product [Microthlaspi erraticum]|uniref:Transmembrane protein n=1 Tax=Microthlaspi erraticum TaxID=1685480 RepID=A0A6D2ISB5_9BRAS|nr:unnamed protein product [Microthlaspi erraticum]